MKRGTPDHPKTKRLARLLCDGDLAQACGLLELLWHFTARYAPDGGIGSFEDAEIADAAKWSGDITKFIHAMTESGWLDQHDEARLVVHDWPDHADDSVHMALVRARKVFADGTLPKISRLAGEEREAAKKWLAHKKHTRSTSCVPSPSLPCPSLPSPSKPLTRSPSDDSEQASDSKPTEPYTAEFEAWWSLYPRKIGKRKAVAEFQRAKKRIGLERLTASVKAFARTVQGREAQYIPYPERWLSRGQYDDDLNGESRHERPSHGSKPPTVSGRIRD